MKIKKMLAALCAVSILTATCFQTMVYAEEAGTAAEVTDTETAGTYTLTYQTDGGTGKIDGNGSTHKAGESVKLSIWSLLKDGKSHTGWTDGENVYSRGEVIEMPAHNLNLKPVYSNLYNLEYEDFSKYGVDWPLSNMTVVPGEEIYLPNYGVFNGVQMFNGWLVNGVHHDPLTYFQMPEEDVFVEVDWLDPISFVLYAGDVDGVITEERLYMDKYPGNPYDLPDATRMSRLGYKLSGWLDTYDGKEYALEQKYDLPNRDVELQAIWSPITVAVRFSGGTGATGKMDSQKMTYDSMLTIPECAFTKEGCKLAGWKLRDRYYQPEETFQVKIAKQGESPQLVAQWIEEDLNPGDINEDGVADLSDLVLLSQILLKDVEFSSEEQEKNADVYRDDTIDASDLAFFKQYVMKDYVLLGLKGE